MLHLEDILQGHYKLKMVMKNIKQLHKTHVTSLALKLATLIS